MARLMMTMQVESSKDCRIVCRSVDLKRGEHWNKESTRWVLFSALKGLDIKPFLSFYIAAKFATLLLNGDNQRPDHSCSSMYASYSFPRLGESV